MTLLFVSMSSYDDHLFCCVGNICWMIDTSHHFRVDKLQTERRDKKNFDCIQIFICEKLAFVEDLACSSNNDLRILTYVSGNLWSTFSGAKFIYLIEILRWRNQYFPSPFFHPANSSYAAAVSEYRRMISRRMITFLFRLRKTCLRRGGLARACKSADTTIRKRTVSVFLSRTRPSNDAEIPRNSLNNSLILANKTRSQAVG